LGGGGIDHVGGAGLGHIGGVTTGLGSAHAMAGAHVGAVNRGRVAGLHHEGLHRFHHRHGAGGYYDNCYWQRLTEPWLPYCY
jgi:hypothetical protein